MKKEESKSYSTDKQKEMQEHIKNHSNLSDSDKKIGALFAEYEDESPRMFIRDVTVQEEKGKSHELFALVNGSVADFTTIFVRMAEQNEAFKRMLVFAALEYMSDQSEAKQKDLKDQFFEYEARKRFGKLDVQGLLKDALQDLIKQEKEQ